MHDEHAQWSVSVRLEDGEARAQHNLNISYSSQISNMSFIHHAIAKKIKEDKEKDKMVRDLMVLEGR